MKTSIRTLIALLALTQISAAPGKNLDACREIERHLPFARVTLLESRLTESGVFVGTFRLENRGKRKLIVGGVLLEGSSTIHIRMADKSVEHFELSGQWREIFSLPGALPPPKELRTVSPGESMIFTSELLSTEVATSSTREFRLLVRTYDNPRMCLISDPFRSLPARPKVTSLENVVEKPKQDSKEGKQTRKIRGGH